MKITIPMKQYDQMLEGWATCRTLRIQYNRWKTGEVSDAFWSILIEDLFNLHDRNLDEIEQRYKED